MAFEGVRASAVAGTFYPAEPEALREAVLEYLREGDERVGDLPVARGVIAPHAGYVYSGPVAGSAFARLRRTLASARRVVVVGPAHRVALQGLALPAAARLLTPLGPIDLDRDGAREALELPQVVVDAGAHALEHSLEVELPFLQLLAPGLPVIPLVVGWASTEEVAAAIDLLWDEETAVVISSDLSHFLPYERAREVDEATARRIEAEETSLRPEEACGAVGINGLLAVAAGRGYRVERLDLRSSGDTAGDRGRVVGYGAFAVH